MKNTPKIAVSNPKTAKNGKLPVEVARPPQGLVYLSVPVEPKFLSEAKRLGINPAILASDLCEGYADSPPVDIAIPNTPVIEAVPWKSEASRIALAPVKGEAGKKP